MTSPSRRRPAARLARLTVAVLILAAWVPAPAAACTELSDPPVYDVFVVVTEDDRTILRLPTGNLFGPSGCSFSSPGRPMFDGRFLGWQTNAGMQVVDLQVTDPPVVTYRFEEHRFIRLDGSLLISNPTTFRSKAHTIELATDPPTVRDVDPPEGWGFLEPRAPMYLATPVEMGGDAIMVDFTRFRVFDPRSDSWLNGEVRTDGPGWPGASDPASQRIPWMATKDWMVFRYDAQGVREWWAYRLAAGTLHGPFKSPEEGGYGLPSAEAIVGDRLYLSATRGTNYAGTTQDSWSVRLPDGDDKGPGLGRPQAGNRTAFFELQLREKTTSTSPPPPDGTTDSGTTTTASSGTDWTTSATTPATTTPQSAPAPTLVALAVLLAILAVRRRR